MDNKSQKRQLEEKCINIAISELPQLKRCRIDTSRSENGLPEERPDLILLSPYGERIGIEHFLVDTLYDVTKIEETFAKYHSQSRQYFNGKKDKNSFGLYESNFDTHGESGFGRYFIQTCGGHSSNTRDYQQATDGQGGNLSKFGFICEVVVSRDDFLWNVLDNNGWHLQRINGIPMIEGIWTWIFSILQLGIIDFFIITTICIKNTNIAKSVYYDKSSNPRVYRDFAYPKN